MQKACRALGIVVHDEAVPLSDHDANGASEVTVQILRAKAGLLVQQIEDRVAAGKVIRPLLVPSSMQAGFTTGMALVVVKLHMKEQMTDATLENLRCTVI